MFRNLSLRAKIILGGCLPLVFLIVLSIICFHGVESLLKSSKWVDHTHTVIKDANSILAAAVDMETGMRGYLLAGKEDFLDPYKQGKASFEKSVRDLQKTVSDNPQQVQLLDAIHENIDAWVADVVEPTIALRRQIGDAQTMDDMADIISEARGKMYFDKFRDLIGTFIEREEKLLKERQAKLKGQQDADSAQWVTHTYRVIIMAKDLLAAAADMETGARGYFLAGKESFLDPYKAGRANFDALVDELSTSVSDNPAQIKLLEQVDVVIHDWEKKVIHPTIELRRQIGDAQTMNDMAALVGEARGKKYFDKFRAQVSTFIEREAALMQQRKIDAQNTASMVKNYIIIGTVLVFGLTVVAMFLLSSMVMRPFKAIFGGLKNFSSLELRDLRETFNTIIENLCNSGEQVAHGSEVLAEGASEQAAGIEEISSSLEEISSMSLQNASNAQEASGLSGRASQEANRGNEAMNRMDHAIRQIQHSSDETAKIIKVIDEIAFQTNILALNAAVEAARAGDAGAGFSVVADEVRSLAMRAAEAARNTSNMIEQSVHNANNGVALAEEVGAILSKIVEGVGSTNSFVTKIAQASQEQSQGIEQISKAIQQMDSVTQQNSASAEESAAAAQEVSNVVNQLVDLVNHDDEKEESEMGHGGKSRYAANETLALKG